MRKSTLLVLLLAASCAHPALANEAVIDPIEGGGTGVISGINSAPVGTASPPTWLAPIQEQNPLEFQVPRLPVDPVSPMAVTGSVTTAADASAAQGTTGNGTYNTGDGKMGEYHFQNYMGTSKSAYENVVGQYLKPVGTMGLAPVYGIGFDGGVSPGGYDPNLFGLGRIPNSFLNGIISAPGLNSNTIMSLLYGLLGGNGGGFTNSNYYGPMFNVGNGGPPNGINQILNGLFGNGTMNPLSGL